MRNKSCEKSGCQVGTFALWFLAGATAGAVAGLLLAPASGAETRKAASDKISAALGATRELLLAVREESEGFVEGCRRQAGRIAVSISAGVEEARKIKQDMDSIRENTII